MVEVGEKVIYFNLKDYDKIAISSGSLPNVGDKILIHQIAGGKELITHGKSPMPDVGDKVLVWKLKTGNVAVKSGCEEDMAWVKLISVPLYGGLETYTYHGMVNPDAPICSGEGGTALNKLVYLYEDYQVRLNHVYDVKVSLDGAWQRFGTTIKVLDEELHEIDTVASSFENWYMGECPSCVEMVPENVPVGYDECWEGEEYVLTPPNTAPIQMHFGEWFSGKFFDNVAISIIAVDVAIPCLDVSAVVNAKIYALVDMCYNYRLEDEGKIIREEPPF